MSSKEKARELVSKYFDLTDHMNWDQAKEAAIICVDEILLAITPLVPKVQTIWYWQEVKEHIEDL